MAILPLSERRLIPWDIRERKYHEYLAKGRAMYDEWLIKEVAIRKIRYKDELG